MKLRQYQVDAFASRVFEGNPAAVCPLDRWLDGRVLQAVAEENNLSETAFFVPKADRFELRWFTPLTEVDLCGHATLASAHVLFNHLGYGRPVVVFETRSGELRVERQGARLAMDFPASPPKACTPPRDLVDALGREPLEVVAAEDYVAVFESEAIVRSLAPDQAKLRQLDRRAVCVTAPGDETDFVSRFFAPKVGIPEDPVTGSAHCLLAPYWAARLGKTCMEAMQVSKRGGRLHCELQGERVVIAGQAVTFMEGEVTLP